MKTDMLKTVADDIRSKGFKVIYIGAFGSYNYNLTSPSSDIDLKIIVDVPIERKMLEKTIRSKERHYLYNNAVPKIECYLITLTEFVYELSIFDLSFLEALFSKYCYISTLFEPYYKNLKGYMLSCIFSNRHKLFSNCFAMADRINKSFANSMFDPNGHKSYHILRLYDFIQKFNAERNFTTALLCNTSSSQDFVMRVSDHKYNRLDSIAIRNDCSEYLSKIELLVNQYSDISNPSILKLTTESLVDMCTSIRASIYGVKQEQLIAKVYRSVMRKQTSYTKKFKYDSRFKLDSTHISGELMPYVEHVDVGTDPNETFTLIFNAFAERVDKNMLRLASSLTPDHIVQTYSHNYLLILILLITLLLLTHLFMK